MAFTVFHGSGALQHDGDEAMQQALQYPESVQQVCPGVDLLLLTDVHPQIFYSLGSEFNVSDTPFGACVATKWTITKWSENRLCMCRFDVGRKITVTFGSYSTLYHFENDLNVLSEKPHYPQHFVCIVIQRSLNWKYMVQLCSRVLQIQYPCYTASQCPTNTNQNIVLIGWQRYSAVSHYFPLQVLSPLKLQSPVQHHLSCQPITQFNTSPVHVLYYVMQSRGQSRQKKCLMLPVVTHDPLQQSEVSEKKEAHVVEEKTSFLEPSIEKSVHVVIDVSEEQKPTPPKKNEEEEWVLTVLYEDD